MNFSLIGFGTMGRMIASLASPAHTVVSIIDPHAPEATHSDISAEALENTEVVIDFSHPSCVLRNISQVAKLKKNMVVGTTGWNEHLAEVEKKVLEHGIGLLHSSNFSIGIQLFLRLGQEAGHLFQSFDQYNVFGHELHHRKKCDAPSGTAHMLSEALQKTMPRANFLWSSTRGGYVPGTHEIFFDSEDDTIEIRHTARSRGGFARGALLAAEWIKGKKGMFTMDHVFQNRIH